jgi:hypothetical protein
VKAKTDTISIAINTTHAVGLYFILFIKMSIINSILNPDNAETLKRSINAVSADSKNNVRMM